MGNLLNMSSRSLLNKGLPYDAEIKYLESSGTQYIDTGIIPDSTTIVQFKFKNLQQTGNIIIGYFDGSNDKMDWRFFNAARIAYFDAPGGLYGERINGGVISVNVVYELELGNYYVKDLSTDTDIISGSRYSETGIDSICISKSSKNVFYYVKIYKNDIMVRDFIPVRIGQVGYMYDKVSGQLFGNSGTGDFILGPDKH